MALDEQRLAEMEHKYQSQLDAFRDLEPLTRTLPVAGKVIMESRRQAAVDVLAFVAEVRRLRGLVAEHHNTSLTGNYAQLGRICPVCRKLDPETRTVNGLDAPAEEATNGTR